MGCAPGIDPDCCVTLYLFGCTYLFDVCAWDVLKVIAITYLFVQTFGLNYVDRVFWRRYRLYGLKPYELTNHVLT